MPTGRSALKSERRKAINAAGLEPSAGFRHEFPDYQTKQSLVYDLQEPFRWIADVTVMEAFESRVLDLPDFYFTGDDYHYKLESEAKRRLLELLREHFNAGVRYNRRRLRWDTVIEQKVVELARYLAGKSAMLDFVEPSPTLNRSDTEELRERIFSISQTEAAKLGIGKGTLHYLRRRAERSCALKAYQKTLARLAGSRR